jgi:uncharacterized protein
MTATPRLLELSLLPGKFAICRFAPNAEIPSWAAQGAFWSVTRTSDELSIVCEAKNIPEAIKAQSGWRILKVHGPFALSETGVLAAVAASIADAKLSLFAISTFDTDYLLIHSEQVQAAIDVLERAGHKVRSVRV